ncbi:hypothetical protein [Nocardia gipuzkoensis]
MIEIGLSFDDSRIGVGIDDLGAALHLGRARPEPSMRSGGLWNDGDPAVM